MKLFQFRVKDKGEAVNAAQLPIADKKGSRPSDKVNKPSPERVRMELGNLRQYTDEARDPNNPSWVNLYKVYEKTMTDSEVITQRRIAENKLKAEPFIIRKDSNESADLHLFFEKPWFDTFREKLVWIELFGYRLIEFGQFDEDGQFISCKLFPLLNVYPGKRHIIVNESDTSGIAYANEDPERGELVNPYDYYLIELGDPEELGLLEILSREVIIKSFARRDWNEHSEKWGQPRIVVKTDAEGNDLNTVENGARNFARNGYAIVGVDDQVEKFEASNNGSGYLIYDKNIDKCDMYIAKIINGQYGIGNEQSFVGTAEVAERILDDFMFSRLQSAQNVINYELIPFLVRWGYPLEGAKFVYPRVEQYLASKAGTQQAIEKQVEEPGKPDKAQAKKKAGSVNLW